jgi:hypothetical protein
MLSSGAAEVPLRRLSMGKSNQINWILATFPQNLTQTLQAGFNSSKKPQASNHGDLQATNAIICSYLDATNEFSDIPMIEGTLQIHNATDAFQPNAALLQWKDIVNRVEVRLFSIQTLRRGFSDISVIPEIKSSFFGKTNKTNPLVF